MSNSTLETGGSISLQQGGARGGVGIPPRGVVPSAYPITIFQKD